MLKRFHDILRSEQYVKKNDQKSREAFWKSKMNADIKNRQLTVSNNGLQSALMRSRNVPLFDGKLIQTSPDERMRSASNFMPMKGGGQLGDHVSALDRLTAAQFGQGKQTALDFMNKSSYPSIIKG